MTSANWLTLLRIVFVPLFLLLILREKVAAAFLVFCAAGLSDALDGIIARRFGQRSHLGAVLDPLADKLLLVSAFVALALETGGSQTVLPIWLVVTVVLRDVILVTGAGMVNLMIGRTVFRPSLLGKLTTLFQVATVVAVLWARLYGLSPSLLDSLFYATFSFTIVSGLHYLNMGARRVLESRRTTG